MTLKKALLFSLLFNISLILFLAGKRIYYSYLTHKPVILSVSYEPYIAAHLHVQNLLPIDSNDVVFVGTSLTTDFPVSEMFGSLHFKNRGIGFSTLTHIYNRIHTIAAAKPKKIFLEGGINDINNNISADSVFAWYKKTIKKIQDISPATEIIVQSTPPVGMQKTPLMPEVIKLNRLLEVYCRAQQIRFADISTALETNGALDSTYTYDGIHLTAPAYQHWKAAIEMYARE